MVTTSNRLADVLNAGYRRPAAAIGAFHKHCGEDSALLKLAQSEHKRLVALDRWHNGILETRCYASKQHLRTLNAVLAAPVPEKSGEDMPSKLKALAEAAKGTVSDVESEAEKALHKLNQAAVKAKDGVGKVNGIAADIEKSAADLNDFAAQTSNFPPSDGE